MDYQWYPGHMTKARRMMEEDIKLVDLMIELVDARIPFSSRNPDIDQMGRQKARLILMNKADLADSHVSSAWKAWFEKKGYFVQEIDARSGAGMRAVTEKIREACREKTERDRRRGIKNRPVRAMVVGIPNVGKSTFINTYAGKACAKTGNRPGVTKGKQWIRLNRETELLDTPGILWPKFEDQTVGMRLAAIGSINDQILNTEELALQVLAFLKEHYPGAIQTRYGAGEEGTETELLYAIAQNRGCLKKGGDPDTEKAAGILLEEFRAGKLGRISLEMPPKQ